MPEARTKKSLSSKVFHLLVSFLLRNYFLQHLFKITPSGIDPKAAGKFFSSRFACGCSVGPDEVTIQGDFKDDLFDVIPEKWKQIDEDDIEDLGGEEKLPGNNTAGN